jgi:hypothetical protein
VLFKLIFLRWVLGKLIQKPSIVGNENGSSGRGSNLYTNTSQNPNTLCSWNKPSFFFVVLGKYQIPRMNGFWNLFQLVLLTIAKNQTYNAIRRCYLKTVIGGYDIASFTIP